MAQKTDVLLNLEGWVAIEEWEDNFREMGAYRWMGG